MKNLHCHETAEAAQAEFIAWCDERKAAAAPFRVCACGNCPANRHNKLNCFENWLFLERGEDGGDAGRSAAHAEPRCA